MLRTRPRNRATRAVGLVAAAALVVTTVAGAATADNVSNPPMRNVQGLNTGLGDPIGVTRDSAGRSYVSDFGGNAVSVFGGSATGDVAPQRLIKGAATLISGPESMAIDRNGFLYVANVVTRQVLEFAPGASGNVAPAGSFGTGMGTYALDLDKQGRIYVGSGTSTIKVFGPNATGAAPAALRTITGPATRLLNVLGVFVDDRSGRLWAANGADNSVLAFAPNANGETAPVRVIKGALTGLSDVRAVALDHAGRIYVTNAGSNTVSVFAAGANGNVAPLRTLSGVATTLSQPWGLWVSTTNLVSVVNRSGDSLATYPPLVAIKKPGRPTGLKVSGTAGARKRTISWKAPASDGGAAITRYKVVVTKGSKRVLTKTVDGAKSKLVVSRSQLANGTNVVTVVAINNKGAGAGARKAFVVRK